MNSYWPQSVHVSFVKPPRLNTELIVMSTAGAAAAADSGPAEGASSWKGEHCGGLQHADQRARGEAGWSHQGGRGHAEWAKNGERVPPQAGTDAERTRRGRY